MILRKHREPEAICSHFICSSGDAQILHLQILINARLTPLNLVRIKYEKIGETIAFKWEGNFDGWASEFHFTRFQMHFWKIFVSAM